jgi:hypothetical protein
MHRLTARFLLLFALAGNVIPLAMAITAAPPHACCRRMAHRCQDSASSPAAQPVFRDPSCCNNHCRYPASTAQWAHPKTRSAQFSVLAAERLAASSSDAFVFAQPASLHSSRAPPIFPIL